MPSPNVDVLVYVGRYELQYRRPDGTRYTIYPRNAAGHREYQR